MRSINNKRLKMNNIIINPEYLKIIEEVKQLKENIVQLYEEKDELIYHICKNIEAEYMSKIGILEYKLYEFQCKILRLKRKIELYQAKLNIQKVPNEEEIEEQLNTEYKEYEEKLNNMFDSIQIALDRKNSKTLSYKDSKEIKSIYRKLIKKLHPDLNKEYSEKNKKILLQVKQAYENGDLDSLRNLELLTDEITEKEDINVGELEEIKQTKAKYETIVKKLLDEINKIMESFPYNQKEFLKNDILVNKRKDELEKDMEINRKIYIDLENILEQLKGEVNG